MSFKTVERGNDARKLVSKFAEDLAFLGVSH